jgi:hypothetical protein
MQLLNVALARSVWLFDPNELNPTGKSLFPDILRWIGEKYSFQTFPKSNADVDKEASGFLFKFGQYQTDNAAINVNFSFFNDGISAESWASTEKTDDFVEDVLSSAALKYGLAYGPNTVRTRWYVSEVNVHLDHPAKNAAPRMTKLCDTMTEIFQNHGLPAFELTTIGCAPDPTGKSYKPPGFMIERKLGAPFSENKYWSKSPFTTADHLRVLREFEQMLAIG